LYKHLKILLLLIILPGYLYSQELIFGQPKISVLYSGLTEKNNFLNSSKIIDVITSWELFLMQNKIPYSVIYDDDLESGIDDDYDILILPSVNYISIDQMEELQKFLVNGKSIICSGSKLEFQKNGIKEYQNLATLFSLSSIEPVSSENLNYQQSVIPNHLNHFKSDTESVLRISTKNQPLFADVMKDRLSACGYIFSENTFNSIKSSIIYGTVGKGKFLWTGFDLNDVIGGNEDLLTFKKLISDAIIWMDDKPDTYIANFSDSLSAPLIITLQYNNALEPELIEVLQKNNIRPNLIVNPDQKISREILNKFTNEEIILELYRNDSQTVYTISGSVDNFNREYEISLSSILINKIIIEGADLSLINSVIINKILYNGQVPGLPKFANKDLLFIPFLKSEAIPVSRNVVNFLNYNPKINCESNPEDGLLEKINQLNSQQYNFTSLNALKKWWSVRERITSEIKKISDSEIELWLTNKNSISVKDLNIFLNYSGIIDRKTLSISLNNSLLEYNFDDASDVIVIKLENILPNSVNKIKVNYSLE